MEGPDCSWIQEKEVALTAGLCELLTNRDRALAMGQAGRSLVECRFDVARMAREYHEHFLDSLVGPQDPPKSARLIECLNANLATLRY